MEAVVVPLLAVVLGLEALNTFRLGRLWQWTKNHDREHLIGGNPL